MNKSIVLIVLVLLISSCANSIKNSNDKVIVETGTNTTEVSIESSKEGKHDKTDQSLEGAQSALAVNTKGKSSATILNEDNPLLGFWVGDFKHDREKAGYGSTQSMYVDEGYVWGRENKINISIDRISDTLVYGHSVVAGNDRPFEGLVRKQNDGSFHFKVAEPGDDKYDGEFEFSILGKQLKGVWTAYGDIEIRNRIYTLEKKHFVYNPDIMLDQQKRYIDWNNFVEKTDTYEMEGSADETDLEEEVIFEEWVTKEFSSATELIYTLNASNSILSKETVENMKRGDLTIIRNAIYARHGYSFKSRPLRVFFDAQPWYIPVHTDIRAEFTELEKQNIELLLKYEKNASEYYDRFGRG